MKVVTVQELIDYIKAQPDDKPVVMAQLERDSPCGCVMVHYGIDHKFDFTETYLRNGWAKGWTLDDEINTVVDIVWEGKDEQPHTLWWNVIFGDDFQGSSIRNYGDLKKFLV